MKIITALFWKILERFGVSGTQFILQIILARLLDSSHYGILSIMMIFTALANVFIQTGFNTALIQNKDVTDRDYSSVFWISLGIAGSMYTAIFFSAPLIATYYEIPEIVIPLRVLALMLFPGAFNSVQIAKIQREMDFGKIFYSSIISVTISGLIGIIIAYLGGGLWALVAQTLLHEIIIGIVMCFVSKLRLKLICDLNRIKILFSFGGKLLVSGLIDTLYLDLRSLVIGKKYNSSTLGYYNRGKQFPQFIINSVNGAVKSVMLPAMSAHQDERTRVKELMRNSITISSYIIFPIMAGLSGIASHLVPVLLTDKWVPCVPYLQIYCFILAFYPIHSCNLEAINSMGRSDIFLKLEIIKKIIGVSSLVFAVLCFDSPIAIALTGAFTTLISCFINSYPNKKLINYSYLEQMRDVLPAFVLSIIMLAAVLAVGMLKLPHIAVMILQIITGITVYVAVSKLLKLWAFETILSFAKNLLKKHN